MILGVGLDVLNIQDIKRSLRSPGFCRQVFAPSELRLFEGVPLALAKAFSLKEAWVKALGTGRIGGIEFHEIECLSYTEIRVSGGAKEVMDASFVNHCQASAHQIGDFVVAVVILSGKD